MAIDSVGKRDEFWRRERLLLLVRSTAEIERLTLVANILGTLLIVAIAQWLPNASDFFLPMVLRFIALFGTAMLYETIRARLRRADDVLVPFRFAVVMAAFAGMSWASLIAPVFLVPSLHPAAFLVNAGVFICVALIISSTAAILRIALAFALGFLSALLAILYLFPVEHGLMLAGGLTLGIAAIGVFSVGSARQRLEAADTLLENMRLAEDLEEALANAEFLAVRDSLTGLYNRRAILDDKVYLTDSVEQYHVLIVDLDNFKQVNDKFGHDMGDRVLIGVAAVFRDFLRELPGEGHVAARLGGEEFAVVLAIADENEADKVASDLKLAINGVAAALELPRDLATASIGMTRMDGSEGIGDALQRADNALYGAKRTGRNRVCREVA